MKIARYSSDKVSEGDETFDRVTYFFFPSQSVESNGTSLSIIDTSPMMLSFDVDRETETFSVRCTDTGDDLISS